MLGVTWAELVAAQGPNPQAGLDVPEQRAQLYEVIARQCRSAEAKPPVQPRRQGSSVA